MSLPNNLSKRKKRRKNFKKNKNLGELLMPEKHFLLNTWAFWNINSF
jgi:hypothetical protein